MTLAVALTNFQNSAAQCDSLIANGHKTDSTGAYIHTQTDKEQITAAAFLNLFIAWETFLEDALTKLMTGNPTIGGSLPTRYVSPPTIEAAQKLLKGVNRQYFDFANHESVKEVSNMYFLNGYPFEPHLSSISQDLAELKIMRNASAHLTSSTQAKLNGLALRIFTTPHPGISLYKLLVASDPRSTSGETVYGRYKERLITAATLIAQC
jgi:hypothetical protein